MPKTNNMPAVSYEALMEQVNKLQQLAQVVRKSEVDTVVANIRKQMEVYGITTKDLEARGFVTETKPSKATKAEESTQAVQKISSVESGKERKRAFAHRAKPMPKFRDPISGATWTGRGKTPAWIKGKKKEQFAIVNQI